MEEKSKKGKAELLRRYLVFCFSLLVIAFGISIITRSNLGTSPITSVPYVASLNTSVSLGTYFFLFTVFLIFLQLVLLGRKGIKERKVELLMQFPVAFILSVFTDLAMWITDFWTPDFYYIKIISLVAGCLVLALGICLEVLADVTMISAEYTIQFATMRLKKDFGTIKICFDVSLVLLAAVGSWLFSGRIDGVREGTVIAALITGPFVRMIMPRLAFLRHWLDGKGDKSIQPMVTDEKFPLVITISREYGSGGHQLGEMIAKELDIDFYDKELISLVAHEGNFTEDYVSKKEQRLPSSLLYQMIMQDYEAPLDKSLSPDDALFVAQSKVIRRIASEKPCVIVGRCANYILKNRPNTVNIFLYADMSHKIERAVAQYGIPLERAAGVITDTDRSRKEHYFQYTDELWGDSKNYHASFDTGVFTLPQIVGFLKDNIILSH